MTEFFTRIHVNSALPILAACVLLAIESIILSLRLWVLIPKTYPLKLIEIVKMYYKSSLIAQLSYATIGDVYRFRKLQKLCPSTLHVTERIEWIGVEKITEPLTLFILGFTLVSGKDVYRYIPQKVLIPFLIVFILAVIFIAIRKHRQKKKSTPQTVSFRSSGKVVLMSTSAWLLDLVALKCLTLEYSLSWSQLMLTLLALSMTSVPPLPWGRWGLFEGVVSGALHSFGVPIEQALFIATTFHILMFVPIGGFFGGLWIYKRIR